MKKFWRTIKENRELTYKGRVTVGGNQSSSGQGHGQGNGGKGKDKKKKKKDKNKQNNLEIASKVTEEGSKTNYCG